MSVPFANRKTISGFLFAFSALQIGFVSHASAARKVSMCAARLLGEKASDAPKVADAQKSAVEADLRHERLGDMTGFADPKTDPAGAKSFFQSDLSFYFDNLTKALKNERWAIEQKLNEAETARREGKPSISDKERFALRRASKDIGLRAEEVRKLSDIQNWHERNMLIKTLDEARANETMKPWIVDALRAARVMAFNSDRTVSLLVGDAQGPALDEALKAAKSLREMNYLVLFDADSASAPVLAEALGKSGFGISGGNAIKIPVSDNTIRIRNPYMRMQAFRNAGKVIATPESILGTAMHLHFGVDYLMDPEKTWGDGLAKWSLAQQASIHDLGLDYRSAPVVKNAGALMKARTLSWLKESQKVFGKKDWPSPSSQLDDNRGLASWKFSSGKIRSILEYARTMAQAETLSPVLQSGSVIFGSAGLDEKYNEKVFELARVIAAAGIPVATGGAGGFMRVANAGAYAAGGISVGIPISGRDQLSNETAVYKDVQTDTIYSEGYGSRIALLLGHRPLVVAVPGKDGTMKEIATTLFEAAGDPGKEPHIVLFDRGYYDGLMAYFQTSMLPEAIKKRIHLVDNPQEFTELLTEMVQHHDIDFSALVTNPQKTVKRRRLTKEQRDFSGATGAKDLAPSQEGAP